MTAASEAPAAVGSPAAVTDGHLSRRNHATTWLRAHRGLVIVVVIPFVVVGIPQLFGWVFLDGDNFLQNFPMRVLVGRDLQHGVLPLWNPYLSSGTPLLGGFNAGAAYPATWLMAILPIFTAWSINLALAYDVAVVGMYLFLRRQAVSSTAATFGAATFAFSGYMTAQIVHIDLIEGAAWLPWMLVAIHALTDRKDPDSMPAGERSRSSRGTQGWVALLALSLGMSILSGAAEAIIDGGALVAIYGLGRLVTMGYLNRANRRALAPTMVAVSVGLAGGVALGAAQWLPGLVFLSQSQRAAATYSYFTSGSLPRNLVTLMVSPFVLGTNQAQPGLYAGPYNFPEVTSYVGILALIATCSLFLRRYRTRPEARHWWIWYVIAGVGLLCALGGQTPFGHVLYLIPAISSERLINRNLLLVDFSLAVLLAWWVHLLLVGGDGKEPRAAVTIRARWRSGQRAEIIVTCAPLAVISVLCLFLWVGGPQLDRLLQTHLLVSSVTHKRLAGLVTAGAVIAGVATWIVLIERRLSIRRLRRLLTAVLVVDLVLFNCFVIRPPTTESEALAHGTMSTALRAQVGDGRFIIYDPDQFLTNQLYALGQTDLNIYTRLPSGQGYTALTDGGYYDATGAHYQEDLNPATLAGSTWDDLNVTTLVSLPGYFVTPVRSPATGQTADPNPAVSFPTDIDSYNSAPTPVADSFTVATGRPHRWYFGGVLTVDSFTIPLLEGRPGDLKIGLVTTAGGVQWLAPADSTAVGSSTHRSLRIALSSPVRAGGLIVEAGGSAPATVGTPSALTTEAGEVALNGRMQYGVTSPHWTFTGMLGSFGVFHNDDAEGWAWVRAPGGGPAPPGSTVSAVAADEGGGQRIAVHATSSAVLERSESWSPGWRATIQPVLSSPSHQPVGPGRGAPVLRSGPIQQLSLPGPGDYLVTFTYAATSAVVGLAVSAVAAGGLILWALVEVVGLRRRRRQRRGASERPPELSPG
jgi:hypothetical protein